MKVIEFLKEHGLEELEKKYAIKSNRHAGHPNLVQLKYNQIDSPMEERIVQECRGIILDEDNDWGLVALPYLKFFNYGEGHAAELDWETARVYEKLDGSLMTLYHYKEEWHVASSGMPDARGEVMGLSFTFHELFWRVWNERGYELPKDTSRCYMFELMTPYNRVVVQHAENRLVLHGTRCMETLEELCPEFASLDYSWEFVRARRLGTIEDIVRSAAEIDPMEGEGYVVSDAAFNRIKVKSPQYVALAHIKDNLSLRRLLEIIRVNESAEFLTYFPEFEEEYYDVKGRYDMLVEETESFYNEIKDIEEQKAFAAEATTKKYSGALFALRANKTNSLQEFFANMHIKNLEKMLGIRVEEKKGMSDIWQE